jgi:hypothetical protein
MKTIIDLFQELREGTRVKLGPNKKAKVLKYINDEIQRYTDLVGFIRNNKGNENYQLDYIPMYNELIRVKQMINVEYKWQGLFNDLSNAKCIDSSVGVFNSAMLYKRLPGGAERIKWLTKKADALYFQENFTFSIPQFNECFISSDGIPFHDKQRSKTDRDKYLTDIIDRYKE